MPVEEIMNLTWHAATSAGPANIPSTHILKAYSSGKSWMGGTLRMTPGLSMCLMPRLFNRSLILTLFLGFCTLCFSGEVCLCEPGEESK